MLDIWDEIPVFLAVAKHLSFSKAAKDLYYSQSYVSKQIQALEAKLNAKLFDRSTTSVELTAAGAAFYDRCSEAEYQVKLAIREALQHAELDRSANTIRVWVKPFCESVVTMAVERFFEDYPTQRLDIVNESWEGAPEGEFDIVVDYLTERFDCRDWVTLYHDVECVHISNAAAEKAPDPLSIRDLGAYTVVLLDKIGRHSKWGEAIQNAKPRARIVSTGFLYGYLDVLEKSSTNITIWTSYIKPATLPNRTIVRLREAQPGVVALRVNDRLHDERTRRLIERFVAIAIESGQEIQQTVDAWGIGVPDCS